MKEIKAEDRLYYCCNYKNKYCNAIKHYILSGIAGKVHCNNCKWFNKKIKKNHTTYNFTIISLYITILLILLAFWWCVK